MRILRLGPLFVAVLFSAATLQAQQSAQQDPQALTILAQYVQASGGLPAIGATKDYTGAGNITFNWAGENVQGTVTVKGRGATQFRMDSSTSQGNESWVVNGLSGVLTAIDGKTTNPASYDLQNAGSLTLPVVRIAAGLNSPTMSIQLMGSVPQGNGTAYQIRLIPQANPDFAVVSGLNGPGTIDLFIDTSNHQLVSEVETFHSKGNVRQTFTHEIDFSAFQAVNGLLVPMTITEKVGGQQTWTVTLTNVVLNTGLSDSDFATNTQ